MPHDKVCTKRIPNNFKINFFKLLFILFQAYFLLTFPVLCLNSVSIQKCRTAAKYEFKAYS